MPGMEQAERIWANIAALGARRLFALAAIGILTLAAVGGSAYYLSRPQQTTLYSGLQKEDVTRIATALGEAGIAFDVSADGTAVFVSTGSAGRARMLLAERGLPEGGTAGYELFDHVDSLGLTSFMQEVTRTRALEGELARTIQAMRGVRAARIHLVLPDRGTFRADRQPPSASVVVRMEGADEGQTSRAIRSLVSAAVPGLVMERVTVVDTAGRVLAAGGDAQSAAAGTLADLEAGVAKRLEDQLRRALAPHLGVGNFEVSVSAALNTDKRREAETVYDPNTRVERSIRTMREAQAMQNATDTAPTTVEQNLPDQGATAATGERKSEDNQRREELVNYELSSRTVETVKDGYELKRLSVAVVVNRKRLAAVAAEENGPAVDAQITSLQQLVASAVGLEETRGDVVTISALEFLEPEEQLPPAEPLGAADLLQRHLGDMINAGAILIVSTLLIWFGLRPAVAAILPRPAQLPAPVMDVEAGDPSGDAAAAAVIGAADPALLEEFASKPNRDRILRLEAAVSADEDQAVNILKQWLYQWGPTHATAE